MNMVTMIGRITHDLEVKYTQGGTAYLNMGLAIDRPPREDGSKYTDFPTVQVWGRQAESCGRYLGKGRMVAIQGTIQTSKRDDKKYTNIVASKVEFLGGSESRSERGNYQNDKYHDNSIKHNERVSEAPYDEPSQMGFETLDEEVPF